MEFKVILKTKVSEGLETTLKFEPTEEANVVCACESIITKVPITTAGYFVGNEYTVTIADCITEQTTLAQNKYFIGIFLLTFDYKIAN